MRPGRTDAQILTLNGSNDVVDGVEGRRDVEANQCGDLGGGCVCIHRVNDVE